MLLIFSTLDFEIICIWIPELLRIEVLSFLYLCLILINFQETVVQQLVPSFEKAIQIKSNSGQTIYLRIIEAE